MVDYRKIMESGKTNYALILQKLSPEASGVMMAAQDFVDDTMQALRNSMREDNLQTQEDLTAVALGSVILAAQATWDKTDLNWDDETPEQIDFEILKSKESFLKDEGGVSTLIDRGLKEMAKMSESDFEDLLEGFDASEVREITGAIMEVAQSGVGRNLMSYLMGLFWNYFQNNPLSEDADERPEVLPEVKTEDTDEFDEDFRDMFKSEWFRNLRK